MVGNKRKMQDKMFAHFGITLAEDVYRLHLQFSVLTRPYAIRK